MSAAVDTDCLACVMGDMDLVLPLGLAGIPCAVVAPPGSPPTHSRFVRAVIPWKDTELAPDALLEMLLRFAADRRAPLTLFFQDDAQLLLVSRNRDRLAPHFRFAIAEPELVELLVDKGRFVALAERHRLPVPATRLVRPAEEPFSRDAGLRYPAVVKPLVRQRGWGAIGGDCKALLAETPTALQALWPRMAEAGGAFLVQELVPGSEACIESHHVYVDAQGEIAAEFTGRKIRTLPLALGHSTALAISDAPDVARLGREIVTRLGLRGVAKLDFKRGPDGRLHLLEINPRFNLWHHLGAAAGVNLPALVHADLTGRPRPSLARPRVGAAWCRPLEDWRAARASGMPALSWARWMLRCDANASFHPRDPMPCLQGELLNRVRRLAGAAVRRAGLAPHRPGPRGTGATD